MSAIVMKRLVAVLTLLGTVVLLGTNGASADVMDTLVDYSTGASNGTWSLWARTTTDASVCDPGTPHWDAANHNYVIEATFSPNCGYIYYQMTGLPHALDGNTVLHAAVDTTVTTGMGADASVEIGYGINYPGFGQTGSSTPSLPRCASASVLAGRFDED